MVFVTLQPSTVVVLVVVVVVVVFVYFGRNQLLRELINDSESELQ
jgi:preprotein translocase subunit SecE